MVQVVEIFPPEGQGSVYAADCIFNVMADADMVSQIAKASAAMVLTSFSWNIPALAPGWLFQWPYLCSDTCQTNPFTGHFNLIFEFIHKTS